MLIPRGLGIPVGLPRIFQDESLFSLSHFLLYHGAWPDISLPAMTCITIVTIRFRLRAPNPVRRYQSYPRVIGTLLKKVFAKVTTICAGRYFSLARLLVKGCTSSTHPRVIAFIRPAKEPINLTPYRDVSQYHWKGSCLFSRNKYEYV